VRDVEGAKLFKKWK